MSRSICLVVLFAIAVVNANAAPKIESSLWDNLVQVDVKSNGARGAASLEESVEQYFKSHDITVDLPIIGSVTLGAKNLDNDEIDLKLDFGSEVQARKKSKLKKIFIPILIFILLKAMTLIPLALGVLAIKTWNAIQLSFVSFVAALGMAVWKLCSKVAHDNHPQIIHEHAGWHDHHIDHHIDHHQYAARSDDAQNIAYAGYAQPQTQPQ